MGAFVAKHSDSTLWHKLLHRFGPFCTEFGKATKWSQMHPSSMKHRKMSVWGPRGGLGAFVAKNSDATTWHKLLH